MVADLDFSILRSKSDNGAPNGAYSADATVIQYKQYSEHYDESASTNILLYGQQYESHVSKNACTWPRKYKERAT